MFYGNFKSKRDVCDEFRIKTFNGTVIFAAYETPDYEGYAEVIFVQGGKIFMVQGSHCSCYGLEDQWEPVEMPLAALRRILDEGSGMLSKYRDDLNEVIETMNDLNVFDAPPEVADAVLKLRFG